MFAMTTSAAALAAPRVTVAATARATTTSAATASLSYEVPGGLVGTKKSKTAVFASRGALQTRRAGEGNPFIEGWLDLAEVVSGGGADLGLSELAENLGSDVYMDINGW